MEINAETLIAIAGLFIGGGSGAFFTWHWQRKKAEAEAKQAESLAAKEMQDMYQQLVADVKSDRNDQRTYIEELKEDRNHLRDERNELRDRLDKTDEDIRALKRDVARNGRKMESMLPFLCADLSCPHRQRVTVTESEVVANKKNDD